MPSLAMNMLVYLCGAKEVLNRESLGGNCKILVLIIVGLFNYICGFCGGR